MRSPSAEVQQRHMAKAVAARRSIAVEPTSVGHEVRAVARGGLSLGSARQEPRDVAAAVGDIARNHLTDRRMDCQTVSHHMNFQGGPISTLVFTIWGLT
jgi:hypothetical protein